MPVQAVSAKMILDLLRSRHDQDVFVSECKNGSTWYAQHVRMDGWAMTRSWVNPLTLGYEIKVSRSDFLGDMKWQEYLPYCNQLYFVCPYGLVDKSELPGEVGLLEAAKNGSLLRVRKKASHRQVQIPEEFWRYLIMCRVKIVDGAQLRNAGETNAEYWRKWLAKRVEERSLGRAVSRAVQETLHNKVERAGWRNDELESQLKQLEKVKDFLTRLGLTPGKDFISEHVLRERMTEAEQPLTGVLTVCDDAVQKLNELKKQVEKVMKG